MSDKIKIGQIFGQLKVIEIVEKQAKCICTCGKEKSIRIGNLITGHDRSCGCYQGKRKDITGQRFGKLVAIKVIGKNHRHSYIWKCQCDCGKITNLTAGVLLQKHTKSCGCLVGEVKSQCVGSKHPNWNHNLSDQDRKISRNRKLISGYQRFLKNVKERDNYQCRCCGKNQCKLAIHHIESYTLNKELRTSIDNGITLCNDNKIGCHKIFHKKYGRFTNRKQLEEFINDKQKENIGDIENSS